MKKSIGPLERSDEAADDRGDQDAGELNPSGEHHWVQPTARRRDDIDADPRN
jgi:hypothetical protein